MPSNSNATLDTFWCLPCVLVATTKRERWAAEALVALLRCDSLSEIVECYSDVPLAWLGPGHVDRVVLVVDHPGVMFPAKTGQREPLGVAQPGLVLAT